MTLRHNKPVIVSARAIIIRNNELLVFRRRKLSFKSGKIVEYYSLPGGTVEPGENIEQAVKRELQEEMTIPIKVIQKVAILEKDNRRHHLFLADIIEGEPRFNQSSEEYRLQNKFNSYEVLWIEIDSLDIEMFRWGFEHVVPLIKNLSVGINIKEAKLIRDI